MTKEVKPVYWAGEPGVCNHCDRPIDGSFIDGRLPNGQWGNFDLACARVLRVTTGAGRGQMYRRQEDGRYMKVEG